MKQSEEMSREELIEEIISNSKHLEETEAVRKDEEHEIAGLEKQTELFKDIKKSSARVNPELLGRYPNCRICSE